MTAVTLDKDLLNYLLKDPRRTAAARDATLQVLQEKMELIAKQELRGNALLEHWRKWIGELFEDIASKPFAGHHEEFWDWVWSIERGVRPQPFIAIWPRGGAKSASAEMACIAVGARNVRSYVWYVCKTQEQADQHVETIGELLEGEQVNYHFPALGSRRVTKYGHSRGWRRNRLRTASGLTIDGIGMDTARRGARVKENRPDFMVFDDIDGKHDTKATTQKIEEIITTSLLPAGSPDLAVLMVQNLIHPDSIFSRLADKRAEFLYDRHVSGPHPAVRGLVVEERPEGGYEIVAGEAIWEGQSLEVCEEQINDWGITAFRKEAQHDVKARPGGIWNHVKYTRCNLEDVPDIVRGCVWIDPAVTNTAQSDSHAIQADGIAANNTIYRFYSWEQITSPNDSIWRGVIKAFELGFREVGIETDQGGDTWRSVYREVWREINEAAAAVVTFDRAKEALQNSPNDPGVLEEYRAAVAALHKIDDNKSAMVRPFAKRIHSGDIPMPRFRQAKAGAGHGSKVERNARMLADYERPGRVVHVIGTTSLLEAALHRFPLTPPHDLVDASYWAWADLRGVSRGVYF